jgi:hypothetical protein
MRLILAIIGGVIPLLAFADDTLSSKVVRLTLSQDQPAEIRLGTHGITTIEFPEKIEALDGFGFSSNPAPDGPDLFQISFNKGTNFLSLKAVRTGVEGNLTVFWEARFTPYIVKRRAILVSSSFFVRAKEAIPGM